MVVAQTIHIDSSAISRSQVILFKCPSPCSRLIDIRCSLKKNEEEYEEEADEVVNEIIGKHRLNTPTARKSKQFVEWLAIRRLKHVDSNCTCGRIGTWWHGYAKKWYELDCFITNIPITPGRWSQLNTFVMDGADHRGKDIMLQLEVRPETKARIKKSEERENEEQMKKRIRWDNQRRISMGRGQERRVPCCVGGKCRGDGRYTELERVGRGSDDRRGEDPRKAAEIE